ncbi:Maltase-glucoamylase, intestinal [Toxocara canis]|uniref:Maltase-glucoamylase, intestinal n=1 Tax=Toxocara canis TaxID=6265 RepID=A0A0B2VX12_TOXCA|nr:Maltase-glucoamylase, intestinal [Toxocara canis]
MFLWLIGQFLSIYITEFSARGEISRDRRIDCLPKPNAFQSECESKGCIWDNIYDLLNPTVPLCYLPEGTGYVVTENGEKKTLMKASTGAPNPFDKDISPIFFSTTTIGATVNIRIDAPNRYEPTVRIPKNPSHSTDSLFVETSHNSSVFSFAVKRKSTGQMVWDTSIGGMLFGDKYIQIATFLPSTKVYGLGENVHQTLKHNFTEYRTWGMFARDEPPDSSHLVTKNLYGVHPFYVALEPDAKAHGVLIWNSNPQEITTGPAPHLVYRTIGGILDIYFFPGPEPEQVVQQYLALIGTPILPAYFALGFQLCRYGYKSLDEVKKTIKRVQNYGIPIDVSYADIDYMDHYKDFTLGDKWKEFNDYAEQLHRDGLHLILIFDPAVEVDYATFERAIEMNASFIEWERYDQVPHTIQDMYPLTKDTKIMLGIVWPERHAAFPDFLDPTNATVEWWANEFSLFHKTVAFDGIWIDMNEPANFRTNENSESNEVTLESLKCPLNGTDSEFDKPPFETANVYFYNGGSLSTKTLCMAGMSHRGTQRLYNTKNLYGLSEAIGTRKAIHEATGKRGVIISRSSFPSLGHYAGHWLGDNSAHWEDLRTAIIGVQEFNLFGIPYVGSDICGFIGATNEELCLRWHQMGAFHSFSRNHNDNNCPPQDPAQWPSVATATRIANLFRYNYLPYLYSLHFEASLYGGTVVRPIFFEFPADPETYDLSYQFMWGSGMMIVPVVEPGVSSVSAYLPKGTTWYSVRPSNYGSKLASGFGNFSAFTTELIPVFVRGGVIIPRQAPNTTTIASRRNPFQILIPLDYDEQGVPKPATGKLYWDDGESVIEDISVYNYSSWLFDFILTSDKAALYITSIHQAEGIKLPSLDIIDVIGYNYFPDLHKAMLNGKPAAIDLKKSSYSMLTKRLYIEATNLIKLPTGSKVTLTWPHSEIFLGRSELK